MVSRLPATSKIAPHEFDAFPEFFVPPLQVFDVHVCPGRLSFLLRERVARHT